MDTPTVRKSKSGDQLVVGDWLAPEELTDGAAEVLHTLAYPGNGYTAVHLVLREQGKTTPFADVVNGTTLFPLATEADLAELREQAERTAKMADIRAFADWLEARPWVPTPYGNYQVDLYGEEGIARVERVAEDLNEKVRTIEDRTDVHVKVGSIGLAVIAWHPDGRPAEPDPADPTGLTYGRGDEGQDPTPTGARVEPHFESGREPSRVGTNSGHGHVNSGHGHVWERPDGVRARCGGPGLCSECRADKALAASES